MHHTWARIERWLRTNAPDVFASLLAPATDDEIGAAERELGVSFPVDLGSSLRRHAGQGDGPGLVDGWRLYDVHEIAAEWRTSRSDPDAESFDECVTPAAGIRDVYWSARWVPVAGLGSSDLVCVDLDPAPGGQLGQVIMRWKSGDRAILATSVGAWLAALADDLEAGRYRVDRNGALEKQ